MEEGGGSSSMTDTVTPCPDVQPAATGSSTAVAAAGDSRPGQAVGTEGTGTAASAGKGVGAGVAAISETAAHAGKAHVGSSGGPAGVERTPTSLRAAAAQQGDAADEAQWQEGQGASRSPQVGSAPIQQADAAEVMAAQAAAAVGGGGGSGAAELVTPGRLGGGAASPPVRPEAITAARLEEAGAEASPAVQLPSEGKEPEPADAEAGTAVAAGGGLATVEVGAGLIDLQTPGSSSSSSLAPSRIWENNVFSPEVTSRSA